jgi:hypothetical protein
VIERVAARVFGIWCSRRALISTSAPAASRTQSTASRDAGFPSAKTVAYRLRHAHRKLDIRSRTDLRRTMSPGSVADDCVAARDLDGRVEVVAERWFGCAQRLPACAESFEPVAGSVVVPDRVPRCRGLLEFAPNAVLIAASVESGGPSGPR